MASPITFGANYRINNVTLLFDSQYQQFSLVFFACVINWLSFYYLSLVNKVVCVSSDLTMQCMMSQRYGLWTTYTAYLVGVSCLHGWFLIQCNDREHSASVLFPDNRKKQVTWRQCTGRPPKKLPNYQQIALKLITEARQRDWTFSFRVSKKHYNITKLNVLRVTSYVMATAVWRCHMAK